MEYASFILYLRVYQGMKWNRLDTIERKEWNEMEMNWFFIFYFLDIWNEMKGMESNIVWELNIVNDP